MKVLVLCASYHPEVTALGPFNTDLCTYLAERGHQVTAVVAFPHYPQWKKTDAYRGVFFASEIFRGVHLIRVPMYIPRHPSPIRRIAYDTSYCLSALAAGGLLGGSPDVIVAMCSPLQAGLVAAVLGRVRRAPFVFHLQDLLPEGAVALGMLRNPLAIKAAETIAWSIYTQAKLVTAIDYGFLDALERKGIPKSKLIYLPNWVDLAWLRPLPRMNSFRHRVGAGKNDFLVGYIGNFGFKQRMETLVEAARLLRDRRDIRFVLVGDGPRKQEVVSSAVKAQLENVEFFGVQPRDALPEMLAANDLHILHQRAEVVDIVAPSKLLTYSASRRPILFAGVPESAGAKFVQEADVGRLVSPEDPEALAAAIVALQRDDAERDRLAHNGRLYVEENFNRDRVLARAEALLTEVASKRRSRT